MKKGLVLEGGAMRGLFTAGVLDVLMENGFAFDGIIGVSAGACFGCNYLSGQIGRCIRYNMKYARDKRYCSLTSLITTGDIYNEEFCYHTLPLTLDVFDEETYEKACEYAKFYAVATDVISGHAVYKQLDRLDEKGLQWVRASASMPLVSRIVEIDGGKYLDGGISDSIPVKQFMKMGYDCNVTVLTQPRGYRKSPNKMMPLIRLMYRHYPTFIKTNKVRHIAYNEQLDDVFEAEKAGNNFVICPKSPLPIGHITHDPYKMKEVYEIGRSVAAELLPALDRFMKAHSEG